MNKEMLMLTSAKSRITNEKIILGINTVKMLH